MALFLPLASSKKRSAEPPDVESVGVVAEMMRKAYSIPSSLFNPHRSCICLHFLSLSSSPTFSDLFMQVLVYLCHKVFDKNSTRKV
jgi:hypothetical protein